MPSIVGRPVRVRTRVSTGVRPGRVVSTELPFVTATWVLARGARRTRRGTQ